MPSNMCENDCPHAAAVHCALQCVPNGYCVLPNTLDDPRERPFPTAMYTRASSSKLTPGWVINSHVHTSPNRLDRHDLPLVIRTRALAVKTQRYPGSGFGNIATIGRSFALSRVCSLSVPTRRSVELDVAPVDRSGDISRSRLDDRRLVGAGARSPRSLRGNRALRCTITHSLSQ